MKNLQYISIAVREKIIETYKSFYECVELSNEELEAKLFGYPELRREVDEGIERANKEVDLERYGQWTDSWYVEVVHLLPDPKELDNYKNTEVVLDEIPAKKTVKDYISTVEGYKQFRDRVDEIILHFDFQKVHDVMEMLDWKWASWYDEAEDQHMNEVPSVYALRIRAYQMLLDAVEKDCGASGGFEVRTYVYDLYDENGNPYSPEDPDDFEHSVHLSLKFVVEEQGTIY